MAYEFNGESVDEGEATWTEIPVTEDTDGRTLGVPTYVAHGGSGPTLWVQGCVHGPEQVGAVAVREFIASTPVDEFAGTLIAVPVVNRTAFNHKQRTSPIDNKDLNRTFPGRETGSFSEQLAHAVFSLAADHADVALDLHTGGNEFHIPGYSIHTRTGDAVEEDCHELCQVMDLPYVIRVQPDDLGGAMFGELADRGIPAVIAETGGEGRVHETHVADAITAIRNVARAAGLLDPDPDVTSEPSVHDGLDILHASVGGVFEARVDGNEHVTEGQEIATITDVTGEVQETITAPYDGVAIAVRTYATARPGDWIFELTPA